MNGEDSGISPRLGLSSGALDAAFPFHLVLDRGLRVLQVGPRMARVCVDVQPGVPLDRVFRGDWLPEPGRTPSDSGADGVASLLLEHPASGWAFQGPLVPMDDRDALLFLGVPCRTDRVSSSSASSFVQPVGPVPRVTPDPVDAPTTLEDCRVALAEARKLASVAEITTHSVILADALGRIEWVNEGFTRYSGFTLEDVRGRTPAEVLYGPKTDPETLRRMREQLYQGNSFRADLCTYRKDGSPRWSAMEARAIGDGEGRLTHFMAIGSDITERRLSQQRLELQYEVSLLLNEADGFRAALPRLLATIGRSLGWQVGRCWLAGVDQLEVAGCWQAAGDPFVEAAAEVEGLRPDGKGGLACRVVLSGEPVWISDVMKDPGYPHVEWARRQGLHAAFAFPLRVRGEVLGAVEFFSRDITPPDAWVQRTLAALGRQVSQFIERRDAEQALQASNALLQGIFEGVNSFIVSTTRDGTIQTFNREAERLTGYSSAEVVGRHTPLLFHDRDEIARRAAILSAELGRTIEPGIPVLVARLNRGKPLEEEWTIVRRDGTRLPVRLSVTALRDEAGEVNGYVGIGSDVTEARRAAAELLKAKEEAEAANRAKSDFLAMMSHEIRTPMNAVIGMSRLLAESRLDGRQREYVDAVRTSGEALLEIINEILDFSRLESGTHLQLGSEPFSLRRMIGNVVRLLGPRAVAKGVVLESHAEPGLPDGLGGDEGRLRQVLVNLVGNAIKFTDQGFVRIRVASAGRDPRGFRLRCEVEDSGIGIATEHLPGLFRPFIQVDSSPSRRSGGTGLGLAISRRIIERMGGDMGVESQPGSGSRFWFEVPLACVDNVPEPDPEQERSSVEAGRSVGPPAGGRRILVAEDQETNRRLVMFLLENLGFQANFVTNGRDAVAAWAAGRPDVILMDCQMPEMDGFAATQAIREREKAMAVPRPVRIIALTANALAGDRERCLAAGMDAYISKPFTQQQLHDAVIRTGPEADAPGPRSPASVAADAEAVPPSFNPAQPLQLWEELGEESAGPILSEFLQDLPGMVASLEAVATSGPAEKLARLAHSIQGVGLSLGFDRLSAQCRRLEQGVLSGEVDGLPSRLAEIQASLSEGVSALEEWLGRRGARSPHAS